MLAVLPGSGISVVKISCEADNERLFVFVTDAELTSGFPCFQTFMPRFSNRRLILTRCSSPRLPSIY